MCTVSIITRPHGYLLAMNRDEQLTRVAGLPPQPRVVAGRTVIAPAEPGGGTWIALNDARVTFALINWYSVQTAVPENPVSRGEVVNTVCAQTLPGAALGQLAGLPLTQIRPFRLIGVFPGPQELWEWSWNGQSLVPQKHPWRARQFISSGFDEPAAQHLRSETFQSALRQKSAGTLAWLRRLHASHAPVCGPFSICMHRAEAATVSYTEVAVSARAAALHYFAGLPCQHLCQPDLPS